MKFQSHQLVCIGCGSVVSPEHAERDFRCVECGELFEVEYPSWSATVERKHISKEKKVQSRNGVATAPETPIEGAEGGLHGVGEARWLPNPGALRWLWKERLSSMQSIDRSGVWRYRELLPILEGPESAVTLREGNTPLYQLHRIAEEMGFDQLYAKHQGMNPTGSFKDIGMTAALSVARENGYQWVACASTGNTSASMAAYAARARMNSLVLLPEGKISWPKLSQSIDYGALTCQLQTDFDGCVRVLSEVVRRAPVYLLNSMNPYRLEGQKTPAFEIAEQLEWQVPDHLIVPGGNLANSSALGKGFLEMKHLGLTTKLPKVTVIQAEGANPLYLSFLHSGGEVLDPVRAETRASAIRIGHPASWRKAVRVIRETGGYCEQVSEAEIAIAKAAIGREGIGCEPASAVTLAGLKKLLKQGKIDRSESVVLLLTGHMLKDSDYTIDFHRGQLLSSGESKGWEEDLAKEQRTTRSIEATPEAILRELEATLRV